MVLTLLIVFWVWQVIAQLIFKHGSGDQSRWLACFILGNLFGASSIWFLMKLYARMNANLAMAIAGGGAFLCVQIALAITFHLRPTIPQWFGYALIAGGMVIATLTAR
jgi:multidrug transporter EmrE-like cation transporter